LMALLLFIPGSWQRKDDALHHDHGDSRVSSTGRTRTSLACLLITSVLNLTIWMGFAMVFYSRFFLLRSMVAA